MNLQGVIWLAENTKPGESLSLESEEIAAGKIVTIISHAHTLIISL